MAVQTLTLAIELTGFKSGALHLRLVCLGAD